MKKYKTCPQCKGLGTYTIRTPYDSMDYDCGRCKGYGSISAMPIKELNKIKQEYKITLKLLKKAQKELWRLQGLEEDLHKIIEEEED